MPELRALRPEDDRSAFRSGNPALDYFFQQYAGQNQFRHHIGTTYVAVEAGRILGYATVSPAHLECAQLAEAERRRLPNYPLPLLRLARLATHEDTQGQCVGKTLLRHVCLLATQMSADFGCVGLLVDAKPEAAGYYETFGFLRLEPVTGEAPMQPVPMFLAIQKLSRLLVAAYASRKIKLDSAVGWAKRSVPNKPPRCWARFALPNLRLRGLDCSSYFC